MESNVHVPANQALISGCLVAPVVALSVFSAVIYIFKYPTGEAILMSFLSGGITYFFTAARKWNIKTAFYDSLLMVETALDLDLDSDGEIGPTQVVQVEVKSEDGNRWQFADLPGKPEALQEFAKRILMGQGFTDETGKLAGLTQAEVRDLREAFVEKGWAGWKHASRKQQGIELWQVGKSVLRAISEAQSRPNGFSPTLPGAT